MTELEKIDVLRARLGIGYREAKEALDEAGGDVIKALIKAEEKYGRTRDEMTARIKEWARRGGRSRLRVKKGDKTVMEIPAVVGAAGVLGTLASSQLAVLGLVGLLTAMTRNYTLEIDEGEPTAHAVEEKGRRATRPPI
ncbi:MAG: DUF4342 domain-containing protein [Bacillota bacterium]|uniref:DUF4342 domain-containing protein n=1 Tax=Desulforudis sp. DRI-14 TaxID=3459793 RepID=UPI00349076E5